jgi:hypothetical protein
MSLLLHYLLGLGATIAIETPLAVVILRPVTWRKVVPWAVFANVLTHVSMHFLLPRAGLSPLAWEVTGETLALVIESAIYLIALRPQSPWLAIAASAACNGTSYVVGTLVLG